MPLDALNDVSDEALLVLFANGDQAAARALTIRLTPRVFGQAYRMLNSAADAEDIAQEALMRLWKIAPEWRQGEAKITTWLYRVVANLCTDRLRKGTGIALEAIPEPEDPAQSASEGLQDKSRAAALQQAMQSLPDRQRQAVALRHLEGLTNPEIAQVMQISVEAVESLTARGKRALTALLVEKRTELGYADD